MVGTRLNDTQFANSHSLIYKMIEIVDPHVHLFALEQGQYGWLQPQNPPFWTDKAKIQRTFTPQDLALCAPFTLNSYVHIEAGFDNQEPWRELDYLEQQATTTPFKSIAGCDLTLPSEDFIAQISALAAQPSFMGVRHILDEQALALLTSAQVLKNLRYLSQQGLIFEAQFDVTDSEVVGLIGELFAQNNQATNIAPNIATSIATPLVNNWVINHVGLGARNQQTHAQWLCNLQRLACIPQIKVKASGWEMAQRDYSDEHVKQTINVLLEIWGEERVMLASNFPLTLLSCDYQEYWQKVVDILNELPLSQQTQRALLSQNALTTYFI